MTLVVQVPDKLSAEAKDLLRQFDKLTGDSLNAVADAEDKNTGGDGKDSKDSGKKKKFWK